MIKGTTGGVAQRVSIRSVLRGSETSAPRRRPRRRTKIMVGWLLYCCTAVGGTAAAFTVRDTLFPALGSPTTRSLWVSANPETTPATDAASTSAKNDTSVADDTVVATTVASSIDDQTAAGSVPDDSTADSTADDHGANSGPQTGTTVAGNNTGTTATTVDDHPDGVNSSTPSSVDSTQSSAPDAGHQKGKGGGSGGGGSETSTP